MKDPLLRNKHIVEIRFIDFLFKNVFKLKLNKLLLILTSSDPELGPDPEPPILESRIRIRFK